MLVAVFELELSLTEGARSAGRPLFGTCCPESGAQHRSSPFGRIHAGRAGDVARKALCPNRKRILPETPRDAGSKFFSILSYGIGIVIFIYYLMLHSILLNSKLFDVS